jgi:hypothetical protein
MDPSSTEADRRVPCWKWSACFPAIPPRRTVLFFPVRSRSLSGGTSGRSAAARTGSIRVLLERNPPNRSFVPAGIPAFGAREQSRSSKTKKELYAHKKRSTRLAEQERRHRPQASGEDFPLGRIKAAVRENEADQKKFYNVTFARTYVDEARNYHDTDSFSRDDLPLVAKLADQAHTFIFERLAELKTEQSE